MKKLLGIEVTDTEFDNLICEQNKGKELKVENGKVVAVEHQETPEELLNKELNELLQWFEEYDNQVKQYQRCQRLGIAYDKDINVLDIEAKTKAERITEIRTSLK